MLYYLLALVTASLSSVMNVVNGELKNFYDLYSATAMIHAIGLVPITLYVLLRRVRVLSVHGVPWRCYLGGAVGVVTVVCSAAPYGHISVSAIVALGLLGQTVTSLLVDQFGLFELPKKPFNRNKLIGLAFACAGIAYMVSGSAFSLVPVLLAFLAGVSIVVSRCFNAELAARKGTPYSTWYNYVVGLGVSLAVMLCMLPSGAASLPSAVSRKGWIYCGGLMGNVTVTLSTILTPRIPAFILTLILFSGQIFTGILLDAALTGSFPMENLVGGVLAAAGLSLNTILDQRALRKQKQAA